MARIAASNQAHENKKGSHNEVTKRKRHQSHSQGSLTLTRVVLGKISKIARKVYSEYPKINNPLQTDPLIDRPQVLSKARAFMRNMVHIFVVMLVCATQAAACNCDNCDFGAPCCICKDYDYVIACGPCTLTAKAAKVPERPDPIPSPETMPLQAPVPRLPPPPVDMPRLTLSFLSRWSSTSPRSPKTSRTGSPKSAKSSPKSAKSSPNSPQNSGPRRGFSGSSDAEIDDSN
jgi:hypothetical protein